jgi:hypothetical protein
MIDERLLHRVELPTPGKALDRGDARALQHDGQGQARIDAAAVDQHRTGAALAVIAALFGARQVEVLAQRIEQRRPSVDIERVARLIHRQSD